MSRHACGAGGTEMTKFDPGSFENKGKRSGARRWSRRDKRNARVAGLAFAAGLAASAWALTVAPSRDSSGPPKTKYDAAALEDRTGNILDSKNRRCHSFDNDTGRMVESGPCEPLLKRELTGTARRLDEISKSFINR
jgi:hypothetical protein